MCFPAGKRQITSTPGPVARPRFAVGRHRRTRAHAREGARPCRGTAREEENRDGIDGIQTARRRSGSATTRVVTEIARRNGRLACGIDPCNQPRAAAALRGKLEHARRHTTREPRLRSSANSSHRHCPNSADAAPSSSTRRRSGCSDRRRTSNNCLPPPPHAVAAFERGRKPGELS